MFRRTWAILDNTASPYADRLANAHIDADLIITAAVAGFCVANLEERNPVEFGAAWHGEAQNLDPVVALLDKLMPRKYTRKIRRTKTPVLTTNLITGNPSSAQRAFARRHIKMSGKTAQELYRAVKENIDPKDYQGRVAYIGLVADPDREISTLIPTARHNVPSDYGHRWVSPGYPAEDGRAWGLIGDEPSIPGDSMYEEPMKGNELVGYVHGMTAAIYVAHARGPQCTPWEIAVSTQPAKLASCFACTLFMYANGYPPSCIHLGRAESWMPFYPVSPGQPGYSQMDEVIAECNKRWNRYCRKLVLDGANLMERDNGVHVVDDGHRARLPLVTAFLNQHTDLHAGGNLVLDALTVHEPVTTFIKRTLCRA